MTRLLLGLTFLREDERVAPHGQSSLNIRLLLIREVQRRRGQVQVLLQQRARRLPAQHTPT
jgi:hypothetical protein